jgi:hypothetical protein
MPTKTQAKNFFDKLETYNIAKNITGNVSADPKSGCNNTSTVGMQNTPKNFARFLIDPQKDLISSLAINAANITRNPNFAGSDGWMVMPKIFTHLTAP